jgi:hypothetical protein
MRPNTAMNDAEDGHVTHSVTTTKLTHPNSASMKPLNAFHLMLCQFSGSFLRAAWQLPLFRSVSKVIRVGAQEQMRWINATFVVAIRTVVQHMQSFWDWAIGQRPRVAMCRNVLLVKNESPVTGPITATLPQPATVSFDNMCPETSRRQFEALPTTMMNRKAFNVGRHLFEIFATNRAGNNHSLIMLLSES